MITYPTIISLLCFFTLHTSLKAKREKLNSLRSFLIYCIHYTILSKQKKIVITRAEMYMNARVMYV